MSSDLQFNIISFFVLLLALGLMALSCSRVLTCIPKIVAARPQKYFFYFITLTTLLWTIAVFPGFLSIDDAVAMEGIKSGQVTIWTSIIYGYLLAALKLLGIEFGGTVVLTMAFYGLFIVQIFERLSAVNHSTKSDLLLLLLITVTLLWPVQLAYLSFQNRDSLYAVLLANLFVLLSNLKFKKPGILSMVEVSGYLLFISCLRHEGIIIGGLVLIFLLWSSLITKRQLLLLSVVMIFMTAVNSYWSKQQLFWDQLSKQYQVIQYVTTLSAILNKSETDTETPSMKELQKYYDFQCIKNLKNSAWYDNERGRCLLFDGVDKINFSFYSSLLLTYFENFSAVKSHYAEKFRQTFNQSQLIQDVQTQSKESGSVPVGTAGFKSQVFRYLENNHSFAVSDTGPTYLIFSAVIALFAMLLLTGTERWLLVIFHLRIPVILFFSPDPQSKYYFTLCILVPISLLLLFEKHLSRESRKTEA